MKDRCLTDLEVTAYVDGMVDKDTRKRIEEHMSECGFCLHSVAEIKRLVGEHAADPTSPTAGALAAAEAIIARHTREVRRFDITVALRNGVARVLETTGNLLPPRRLVPVTVRRAGQTTLSPMLAKSLSGYLVTVELAPKKDKVQPKVTLVEETSSARPDGIKAKFYSPGTCETKYTSKGKVLFPPVGSGSYRIDIEEIGSINLDVE